MIIEHRASIILFNVLSDLKDKHKPFLLPANVCPIVPLTYLKAGVAFEFIDIDTNSLCLNEQVALAKLTTNTYGGIHYVRTFGVENNPSDFFARVKSHSLDLFVIDDKCLNIPKFRITELPKNIDLEIFSTGYSKYVDIGWGGVGYLQPQYIYQRRQLPYKLNDLEKLTASLKKCLEENQAYRYKDTDWLGDTLFSINPENYQQLIEGQVDSVRIHKDAMNTLYSNELPKEIQLSIDFQNWRFNIRVPRRNELLENIFSAGLFASAHYSSVTHLFDQPKALCAEKNNGDILNLFNDFRFDLDKAKRTISIIKKHLIKSDKNYVNT
jgi:hypothetical protein